MMARLIDANVAIERAKNSDKIVGTSILGTGEVVEFLEDCPTVDAVEVVRCRDCKHRYNGKDCTHPLLLSYSFGAIRNVKDNDFCSYGERKGGDGNG